MKDFFFKPDMSYVDCIFLAVSAHGFAKGDFLAPVIIVMIGVAIHLATTNRWYD